jgi:hypothetical protein
MPVPGADTLQTPGSMLEININNAERMHAKAAINSADEFVRARHVHCFTA